MEKLAGYNCYALQMVFMKVRPFPWEETVQCLGSFLEAPYSKLALHKCMHAHGSLLFNHWRQYLLKNVKSEEMKAALYHALTPLREYVRGVWVIKESDNLTVISEGRKWYRDYEQCDSDYGDVTPSIDQPDSYPMQVIFTVQSKCYSCTQQRDEECLCQWSKHCPITNPCLAPAFPQHACSSWEGPSYYYRRFHTKEDNVEHCVINASTHIAWEPTDGTSIDYYNVTNDEWFASEQTNAVLAYHDTIKDNQEGDCICWSECCPCAIQ